MKNGQFSVFELRLKEALELIREDVSKCEDISAFKLTITASGRVDGDLKLQFRLENEYDSKADVQSGSLQAALVEYLRRNDWAKWNEPLCLPNVKTVEDAPIHPALAKASAFDTEDEIPF